jgi:hypothetical protein
MTILGEMVARRPLAVRAQQGGKVDRIGIL